MKTETIDGRVAVYTLVNILVKLKLVKHRQPGLIKKVESLVDKFIWNKYHKPQGK